MASPTLDLVCCRVWNFTISPPNHTTSPNYREAVTFLRVFNISAILSSCLSIVGAIYILLPKRSYVPKQRKSLRAVERQKKILTWLSVADILACAGVLAIAIIGLVDAGSLKIDISENLGLRWACIIITAWIQYYYVATYFWTFFYALDVNLMLRGSNRKMFPIYFVAAWLVPALMVIGGLVDLYESSVESLQCNPTFKRWQRLLPHYMVSYVPMLIVLLVNPVMYWFSAKKVAPLLISGGMFTDKEREIQRQVNLKFFFIVLVFTLCWLPNVTNGIILLNNLVYQRSSWHTYGTFNEIVWVAMAIMNPLQAFLNALIYWGPGGCTPNPPAAQYDSHCDKYDHSVLSSNWPHQPSSESPDETSPLMSNNRRTRRDGRN